MKLYFWRSGLLRSYGDGWIVVVADSVESARLAARVGFAAYEKVEDEYFIPDEETTQMRRDAFERDIENAPTVVESLFISGSD